MNEKRIQIYLIYDLSGKNDGYIGATSVGIKHRFNKHLWDAQNNEQLYVHRAIRKLNYQVGVSLLEAELNLESWAFAEKKWIKYYRETLGWNLWNLTEGGDGVMNPPKEIRWKMGSGRRGRHNSVEHNMKNRISHLGKVPWIKGKHHKPESIEKSRQGHIGTHQSSESNEKNRQSQLKRFKTHPGPFTGHRHTKETIEKDRQRKLGKPSSIKGKHYSQEEKDRTSAIKKKNRENKLKEAMECP